jgi:hypothetical protein
MVMLAKVLSVTAAVALLMAYNTLLYRPADGDSVPWQRLARVEAPPAGGPVAGGHRHVQAARVSGATPTAAVHASPLSTDVAGVTLTIEAAVDEDGDIKLWRRDVGLHAAEPEHSAFWRDALSKGCGGELFEKGAGGTVHARLSGCDVPPPNFLRSSPTTTHTLPRGAVAWRPLGRDSTRTFVLALADVTLAEEVVRFGELDTHSGTAALDELRAMAAAAPSAALDPPMRFTMHQ